MADVFISYAREDRHAAARLAQILRSQGWTVWWDREIQVGRRFSEVIEAELEAARCVVVLWSRASITSRWVSAEASEGLAKHALVPVRIEDVRPPLEFRRLQSADAFTLSQEASDLGVKQCLDAVTAILAPTAETEKGRLTSDNRDLSPPIANTDFRRSASPEATGPRSSNFAGYAETPPRREILSDIIREPKRTQQYVILSAAIIVVQGICS